MDRQRYRLVALVVSMRNKSTFDHHALNGAAAARQIDHLVLTQRIAVKDDQYRAIHGALTGARQRIEDLIHAAGEDAEALHMIDVFAGWSSESTTSPESPPV